MGCWSQTLPRCTWCQLGWQVMMAPSPPPFCLFVLVCRSVLYLPVCLSVSLPGQCTSLMEFIKKKNMLKNYSVCLHQKDFFPFIFSSFFLNHSLKYPRVSLHPPLPPFNIRVWDGGIFTNSNACEYLKHAKANQL